MMSHIFTGFPPHIYVLFFQTLSVISAYRCAMIYFSLATVQRVYRLPCQSGSLVMLATYDQT